MIEKEIRKIVTEEILNALDSIGVGRDSFLKYNDYLKSRGLR